jgi:Uma2 family endonuclease
MIQAPPRTILEVFESLPEGTLCQLITNQLIMSPARTYQHQHLVTEIIRQLSNYVIENNLGEVVTAPVDVYFDKENVFQPDILFIAKDRLEIVKDGRVKGSPDLIIEILSPGTESYDKRTKKEVYEQHGVQEYWMVDPLTKNAMGYKLVNDQYKEIGTLKEEIRLQLFAVTIQF